MTRELATKVAIVIVLVALAAVTLSFVFSVTHTCQVIEPSSRPLPWDLHWEFCSLERQSPPLSTHSAMCLYA